MRTNLNRLKYTIVLLAAMSLSACLTDDMVDGTSPSSIDGLSIEITNPGGVSSIETPDITVNISGTVSSRAGIDSISWLNDRGGKGVAHGTETWSTGNIVLQLGTNNITITAKDVDGKTVSNTITVVRENTTAPTTPTDNSEVDPVLMYSYNANLGSAAPADGASINPQPVYLFVVPGTNWKNRGFDSIVIQCCKGVSGPGVGEGYAPQVSLKTSPWSAVFDMSGFAPGGTRRAKIRTTFDDGTASAVFRFNFTVASNQIASNRAPFISGSPSATATVGNQYNFRPTAADADGDTMSFSISNKPSWATFSKSTGRLYGTPGPNDVGTYPSIGISVSDGQNTTKLSPFSITVGAYANGSATLSWDIPTRRTDNTSLINLAGFNIYYGQTAGDYANVVEISNPGLSSYMVNNLSSGTWYFVVTALDKDGLESNPSNRQSKTF